MAFSLLWVSLARMAHLGLEDAECPICLVSQLGVVGMAGGLFLPEPLSFSLYLASLSSRVAGLLESPRSVWIYSRREAWQVLWRIQYPRGLWGCDQDRGLLREKSLRERDSGWAEQS